MSAPQLSKVDTMRHSCAHLMASAIQELWPEAKFGVGPVVEHGFYYDVDLSEHLTPQHLLKIEKRMREIQKRHEDFVRKEMPIDEAIDFFRDRQQTYKVDLLKDLKTKGTTKVNQEESFDIDPAASTITSVYETGKFIDLCRGPHVANTKEIGAFKVTKIAGAYWRGKDTNPQLQRVYGLCFETQADLDAHLVMLEEAEKRDHRKIGQTQELFFFDDLVGKGLPIWLPRGTVMKEEVEKLAVDMERRAGYQRVTTPHMGKEQLYLTSGHLPYYAESMYPPMVMDDGTYYLKAMNCPHHHLIYRSKLRSYRELPVRLAEYGTVYRNELSGALAGLLRVRMLSMNDAHIYCRRDQIEEEFTAVLELTMEHFKIFGLENFWFRLSKWDPDHKEKYVDEPENWEFSESVLRNVLQKLNVRFVEVSDEAAFYGPKVDVQFKSVIGREETMSTIQLDFIAKERFHLNFVNDQGQKEESVFVIHRAPLSTHERFMAFLIEHYAGVFPVWLAPVQVMVIPVGEAHLAAARALAQRLSVAGVRAEVDEANESVGKKIRNTEMQKVPHALVIGDKESPADGQWTGDSPLAVRVRGQQDILETTLAAFQSDLMRRITERTA